MLSSHFISTIFQKHQNTDTFPATSSIARLITKIILVLFPEQTKNHYRAEQDLIEVFEKIEADLASLLASMQKHLPEEAKKVAKNFVEKLPEIYRLLNTDIQAIMNGDPAAKMEYEIVRAYPGFYAIAFYRMAHLLHQQQIPLLPRVLTEYAHSKTGIDIHPGAKIDEYFFIDHGTGIVIGETTQIGKNVKIYQGVTLGALSVSKQMASKKRHPTVENNVVIYSGATILGGETVIGENSIIGGNVWLTHSIPANTKIYHQESVKIS